MTLGLVHRDDRRFSVVGPASVLSLILVPINTEDVRQQMADVFGCILPGAGGGCGAARPARAQIMFSFHKNIFLYRLQVRGMPSLCGAGTSRTL